MRFRFLRIVTYAAFGLAAAAPGGAQQGRRELVGIVREANGRAIDGAAVEIQGGLTRTDVKGMFRFTTTQIDTLTITVRRVGFAPVEALLSARNRQWDTVVVELDRLSQELSGVRVEGEQNLRRPGLKGFEERVRAKVGGLFITRDDIVQRNSSRLSDVLQTRRGINLVRIGSNRYGVRFSSYLGSRGSSCIPDTWLDGQRARGMEIDDIAANTVEGMELYDSFATVPFEFAHSVNSVPCGTIVIWTRPPGTKKP